MKKIIAILILLIFLAGCNNISSDNGENGDKPMNKNNTPEINVTEIEKLDTDWNQVEFEVQIDESILEKINPINTEQYAIEVAEFILEEIQKQGKLSEYELVSVIHSNADNIWRFEYSINQDDGLVECGAFYVVLSGEDGNLIKAWIEE